MSQRHIVRIVLVSACSAGLIAAWPTEAAAAKKKGAAKACTAAYKAGMPLKAEGRLIEARRVLQTCAKKGCGGVRGKCKKELSKATKGIASVVPTVTDENGREVTEVEVSMDGEVLATSLTGNQMFVNPGDHEFSFRTSSGAMVSKSVSVALGQRSRPISVSLPAVKKPREEPVVAAKAEPLPEVPAAAPAKTKVAAAEAEEETKTRPRKREAEATEEAEATGGSSHTGAYILGGVGVLGVGGYALLTYWGRQDNAELDRCTPFCPKSNVDHIKKMYLLSDISLGVGLAALVASTWLFLSDSSPSTKEVAAGHTFRTPYVFDLQATGSGAFASVSGGF